jgi:hypothetical protein
MKLSDRIDEIRIPVNRKTLSISVIGIVVYSLVIITIYECFFKIKEIEVYPNGSIEYRVKPK